jgi:hypothetical protein
MNNTAPFRGGSSFTQPGSWNSAAARAVIQMESWPGWRDATRASAMERTWVPIDAVSAA